jgi:hypothetical protein
MSEGREAVPARQEYGFQRTECACGFCRAYCKHMPGTLDPTDLSRMCPPGEDLLAWAEVHLRALVDQSYPVLVPARGPFGHCHWYFEGRCAVHQVAPFSCAFFDSHMSANEAQRRIAATIQACRDDAAAGGEYQRVWLHLCRKGLIGRRGDRVALAAELREIERSTERNRRRICGE